MKIYCIKHPKIPMKYNGEARGPIYICKNCGIEIEVDIEDTDTKGVIEIHDI